MRFAAPELLHLLWGIPILIAFYALAFHLKDKAMRRFGNPALLRRMTPSVSRGMERAKATLLIFALSFAFIAAARPQFGRKVHLVKRRGIDVVIALDISLSMLAEDIKPNRLEYAKNELASFIDRLKGDRIGIVAFAGKAFVQCPLTIDYSAAKFFLESLSPDAISVQGTAIGEALGMAEGMFREKSGEYEVIVLLTDGEDTVTDPLKPAKDLAEAGIRVYTLGIGSPSGELIPLRDESGNLVGYKKDRNGNLVRSRMNEVLLRKIAEITGGAYYRCSGRGGELEKLYDVISGMEKREISSKQFSKLEDRFQYFLLPAVILLIIESFLPERRRPKEEWRGRAV